MAGSPQRDSTDSWGKTRTSAPDVSVSGYRRDIANLHRAERNLGTRRLSSVHDHGPSSFQRNEAGNDGHSVPVAGIEVGVDGISVHAVCRQRTQVRGGSPDV